jgi:LmbE family N-acetylglucosaminyl deacetylase
MALMSLRTRLWAAVAALAAPALLAAQAPPPRFAAIQASTSARLLPIDRGAAAVWQSLKKLDTRASILLIVAHPDDEDGGLLTAYSRGLGARVALLTLNRGEGGENLMSNDFNDALGLVRTQELLAADRYYGVQQFFTNAVDFGFSKTKAGSMRKWGHQQMLAQVVRVVRMVRPLVLASVFVGGPSDGHGNHEVAGELTQEAYNAAGDPKMFPDQIREGLRPWKPLKVYARVPVYAFTPKGIYDYAEQVYTPNRIYDYVHQRWIQGQPSITVRVQEGGYDPVLGESYVQIARKGLSHQRTQLAGIGVPDLGSASVPYHLYAARVKTTAQERTMFDGIDTSLAGIAGLASGGDPALRAGLEHVAGLVWQAIAAYRPATPQAIAPLLAQGLAQTNLLLAQVAGSGLSAAAKYDIRHELEVKRAQFNNALVEALGLQFTARLAGAGRGGRGGPAETVTVAIPGQRLAVETHFANPSHEAVTLEAVTLRTPAGQAAWTQAAPGAGASERIAVTVPENTPYTRPYYSRPNVEQPVYNIDDARYAELPTSPYPLTAWAKASYRGVTVEIGQVVQTVERTEASGIVENPLVVAPAISVAVEPHNGIIPLDAKQAALTVTIHSNVPGRARGTVRLRLPPGWTSSPAEAAFDLQHNGEDQPLRFAITPVRLAQQPYTITAVASYAGKTYEEGYHTAGYAGLRPYNLYRAAVYQTRGVAVKIAPHLNVAYIAGTGDNVPQDLRDLGVDVHLLAPGTLASADLSAYSTIVLGIRAYAARADLRRENGRLLDYVRHGGVLIVQYETSQFNHNYGPYPYNLGGNGATVSDETDAVRILQPNNPVLSWPNQITAADFANWIEERGHGFMLSWDAHYQPLLEMHDPQQVPQRGGLLYAPYGKGVYVYEGLALYRQLDQGVPGAYRIFANLLSLPKRPRTRRPR